MAKNLWLGEKMLRDIMLKKNYSHKKQMLDST